MRVDVHAPSHRSEGGLLPLEAVRYDIVVMRPEAPAGSSSSAPKQDVEIGRLRIDTQRRIVLVDGASVRMSAREFTLLHYLASYPDVVFSREALLRAVWGSSWRTEGSVTEYVRRLRMLLAPSGIGECIVTRKGFGYAFDPDAVQ
ncbi:MAG: winged helix-turn-helix domain-containing protein, partial [Actinomycetota bacterium]